MKTKPSTRASAGRVSDPPLHDIRGSGVGAGFKPALLAPGRDKKRRPRSLRLQGYDYVLAGAYFVTVCTHRRVCLFGQAADGEMRLNGFGAIVEACWRALPRHYLHVRLDAFVVMPNHVHAIVVLTDDTASAPPNLKRSDLSEIVRAFKTFSSRRVNQHRGTRGIPVWQRGYHDRIIRDEASLREVRAYIERNPPRWDLDRENPVNAQRDFGTEGGFETRPYVKPSNAATGGRTRSPLVIL